MKRQCHIHDNINGVLVGRGSNASYATFRIEITLSDEWRFGGTDGGLEGPTDKVDWRARKHVRRIMNSE